MNRLFNRVQSVDHGSDLTRDTALIVGVPDGVTAVDIIDMLVEEGQEAIENDPINQEDANVIDIAANKVCSNNSIIV